MHVIAFLLVFAGLAFTPDVIGPRLVSWWRQRRARRRAEMQWRAEYRARLLGRGRP
jgi:hypothetical protein